ncbi:hypothetical protein GOODEAATRI_030964 [Goodea atripinnis]|uniref:Uncharacterized protein n=1 Tax=Goodea atripinnis TaxID=208336 RepID=A0ABV0MY24_9TELE
MEEKDASGFAEIADVKKKLHDCRTIKQDTELKLRDIMVQLCIRGVNKGGETTSVEPSGPSADGGGNGEAHDDEAQGPNQIAVMNGSMLDSNADGPDGAQDTGTPSDYPHVPPQRQPFQNPIRSMFGPDFSSTPQQQRGAHAVLPDSFRAGRSTSAISQGSVGPTIALATLSLPKFSGDTRSYLRWNSNWGALQARAEPTGSPECRLFHLLDSLADSGCLTVVLQARSSGF